MARGGLRHGGARGCAVPVGVGPAAAGCRAGGTQDRERAGRRGVRARRDGRRAGPAVHPISLGPLPGAAEEELARSLMGDAASREVLDAVLASVEGNPLFLEERLTSLLETRALVREQGVWRISATAGQQVPQALERLVRSRVDRLSPAARDAVRPASVLGTEFGFSLLTAVCTADEPLDPPWLSSAPRTSCRRWPSTPSPSTVSATPSSRRRPTTGCCAPSAACCTAGPPGRWRPRRRAGWERSPPCSVGTSPRLARRRAPCGTSKWRATTPRRLSPTTKPSPLTGPPWRSRPTQ